MESVHINIDVSVRTLHNWWEKSCYFCEPEVGGSAHMRFAARLNPSWGAKKKSTVDFHVMIPVCSKHRLEEDLLSFLMSVEPFLLISIANRLN